MNSVERVVHYSEKIEQEPPHEIPEMKPKTLWPAGGRIEIKDVFLKYRPELPDVLRGLTMDVAPGEKVGIVGRTGAGKSSIMTALYRLVELSTGSILIDGMDISKIGLRDLRSALAIIPQDPVGIPSLIICDLVRSPAEACRCCSPAHCDPTWTPSIDSMMLSSGTRLGDPILWIA